MATKPRQTLLEILTLEERIDLLEDMFWPLWEELNVRVPSQALRSIRKDLNQITGEIRHFENQFREHMESQKRKKLQKTTDENEAGVTEV